MNSQIIIFLASKVGKTHLCHLLCIVLPPHYKAIYIDTQDGFSSKKIKTMAEARDLDYGRILEKIKVAKADTTTKLEYSIKLAQSKIGLEPGIRAILK